MRSDQHDSGLYRYVRYGPAAGGSSAWRRMLGLFLWWRIWVIFPLLMAAFYVLQNHQPASVDGRTWGFAIGIAVVTVYDIVTGDFGYPGDDEVLPDDS